MRTTRCQGFNRHRWKRDNSGNCRRCGVHRNPEAKPLPFVTPAPELAAWNLKHGTRDR